MIHLKSVEIRPFKEKKFPFSLPILQGMDLNFSVPVSFFAGENGTGKSSLMETIACAAEMVTVGSENVKTDKTLSAQRELAKYFRLSWTKKTRKGFFLRAEDFFGYAKRLNQMRFEMEKDLQDIDHEFEGRSEYARNLARMSTSSGLDDIQRRYGDGLDARSHGESFLALFQSRFVPGGLYLLDEPEAPLSPLRQLALLSALKEMVAQDSQFIIATHSPILMAFPGAEIFSFDGGKIRRSDYENLEHVRLTRDFLQNPGAFVERL